MTELLEALGEVPEAVFEAGEVVIRQGGVPGRMYVLAEGEIQLVKGDVAICRISSPGSVFGEMSALLGIRPTASVVSVRRSVFRVVGAPELFLGTHPGATLAIARLLAHRIHWLTARYAAREDDDDSLYWRWH